MGERTGRCVTRGCYARGDCGYWAHPSVRCAYLKPGDPIEAVYFQLGNPGQIDGSEYTWFGKGDPVGFTALIENGKLRSINCRQTPPSAAE
jgi:hypothetical protein